MAIRRMTSKEAYEADPTNIEVVDYPGANGPLYMKTTHVGLVLEKGEHKGYNDSDFYAVVWDAEKKCPTKVEYASTRGWTYPNTATIDAPVEVLKAYETYLHNLRVTRVRKKAEKEARTPRRGKDVKVVRGRKTPIGTEGVVIWLGECKFSGKARVGIKTPAGETHFTAGTNVEVVLTN